jgi:hypothetical protein
MQLKYFPFSISILTILLLTSSCKQNAVTEGADDIVFGVHFGMEKEAFFKHCWELNQEKKTGHGTIDNNVMYEDSTNFEHLVVVNFYPDFVENKIAKMPMSFYYKGWAPWNKTELTQDQLLGEIVKWFEMKYGGSFKEKQVTQSQKAFYKVLGPITVRVYKDAFDEMLVRADISHAGFLNE